jgi:hypothetical protein
MMGIDTAVVHFGNEHVFKRKKYMVETPREIELLTLQGRNRSKRFHMMVLKLEQTKREFLDYHLKLLEEIEKKYPRPKN